MKIYSDTITHDDLRAAVGAIDGVTLDSVKVISNPRIRAHGWTVRLTGSSTRHRNSGQHGAATWDTPPATWDEHGQFFAHLFAVDSDAHVAGYDGVTAFRQRTGDAYLIPTLERTPA